MSNLQRINQDLWINAAGYCNRIDPTNINERHLTAGTQNVIIENLDAQTTRVMTRYGYKRCQTITGLFPTNSDPIFAGSYRWDSGFERRFLVAYKINQVNDTYIQVFAATNNPCEAYTNLTGNTIKIAKTDFVRFTSLYDTGLQKHLALWVLGDDNIYYWDGTGGSVTVPNPLATSPIPLPTNYTYDYIVVYKNQVYIGSKNSKTIYVSRIVSTSAPNLWQDFNFTTFPGRLAGEGGHIILDTNCRGFGIENDILQIYGEHDYVYDVEINTQNENNAGLVREDIIVTPKKTSSGQGAIEQELITNIKNGTIYLTRERTVDILGNIENFSNTQATPISDVVQIDFDNVETKQGNSFYHKRNVYFMFPESSTHLIYNLERGYWQPPQRIDIAGMLADNDKLYGFQYVAKDNNIGVFRMDCYNGYNKENIDLSLTDDGAGYTCRIVTPYTHLGVRHHKKFHNSIFVEGYISANSIINVKCLKDYGGYGGIQEKDIHGVRQEGDKVKFINDPVDTVSLGKSVLGSHSLGNDNPYLIPKFHHVLTFSEKNSYYERQIQFEGEELEQRWGIISYSTNAGMSSDTNFDVTK